MPQPKQFLQIPVENGDLAGFARQTRKHLMLLQRLAMNNLFEGDDLTRVEMEAFRAVTDLMIRLQEVEENAAAPASPP